MVETWVLYTAFLVLPAAGLMLYLVLLSLERYWAEFNAESQRIYQQIQGEIDAKKAARRAPDPLIPPVKGIPVEMSEDARRARKEQASHEARQKAFLDIEPRALANLVKAMMTSDEIPGRKK